MRVIISPAKKMVVDTDSFPVDSLPRFLDSVYTRWWDCDRMEATKRQERKRWMHPITDMT